MEKFISGTCQSLMVHDKENCNDEYCCIHNPSNHHMVDWPLHWRSDRHIFERIDPEGVGHPDPDDIEYHKKYNNDISIHGCNGLCCSINFEKYLFDKNILFWKEELKYFLESNYGVWNVYVYYTEKNWKVPFEKIKFSSPSQFIYKAFNWSDDFIVWNDINNSWWGYYNYWKDEVLTT